MGRLVYVEGIIGAGKSKFCREVAKRLNYRTLKEPVDKPHLDRFYTNPKAFAWNLQVHMLHTRIGLQLLAACEALYSPDFDGAMLDRSVFGDAAFEEMHFDEGNISELDHDSYKNALLNMKLMLFPPTTLVFLDVRPETALARIKERAMHEDRPYESGITLEYLQRLSEKYKKLIRTARDGRWPWGHSVDVQHMSWDPACRTSEEWDAVAAGLKEDWSS